MSVVKSMAMIAPGQPQGTGEMLLEKKKNQNKNFGVETSPLSIPSWPSNRVQLAKVPSPAGSLHTSRPPDWSPDTALVSPNSRMVVTVSLATIIK